MTRVLVFKFLSNDIVNTCKKIVESKTEFKNISQIIKWMFQDKIIKKNNFIIAKVSYM